MNELPIPDQTNIRNMVGARKHPIDLSSSENGEPARDLLEYGIAGENYYFRRDNPPYFHRAPGAIAELYVRAGILDRLIRINTLLRARGLELYVFDAYRPVEVQTYFHDEWVPNFLRDTHPDWTEEEVLGEVSKYWAKSFPSKSDIPSNSPPPHATGAVLDLTIRDMRTHLLLNMGGAFDVVAPISFADHFEQLSKKRALHPDEREARNNRRLLYNAMATEGFVIHPNEWWHFGYGDQVSAFHSGESFARYSTMWLPGEDGGFSEKDPIT